MQLDMFAIVFEPSLSVVIQPMASAVIDDNEQFLA
jgi:hypothetical protein